MQTGKYYVVGQIEKALFELLGEKDYADITVTDIIKKAEVSRASVYRHYSSIGEIMDKGMDEAVRQVTDRAMFLTLLSSDETKIKELLYRYTNRNLEAHEIISSWLPSNVAMIFSRMMTYFQDNVIPSAELSQSDKYRLSARSGVINSILMRWIADGKKETTEEIIGYIMEYIMRL